MSETLNVWQFNQVEGRYSSFISASFLLFGAAVDIIVVYKFDLCVCAFYVQIIL